MPTSRQQDAICPACGMVFRTRAHQVDCAEAALDQRLVDAALAISNDYVSEQLKKKEQ
jgi:hypothetical protein